MTFQFLTTDISAIAALAGNASPDNDGTRRTLYDTIFAAITDGFGTSNEVPKEGVDASVWLWVRGARDVNSGVGYFADFIQDYTAAQYQLRYGVPSL